ncbi:hypothetical protein B0J11DRAFT_573791 [Dendryphion nanum]|uniref:Zn(2)-C6 fungal-type domain-containing protein n=1 Tax=Dendryphion nanum TaxID=256645 RepID=A0A9P9CYG8_9PLEO|nr:hypothetical protein B0J11DRAFT_573791 [Dendryphion nanum]
MPRDRPRQRLTQACDYCRTRKIKCDLRRPCCANCENRSLICKFSTQQRKRGPRPASDVNKVKDAHSGPEQALSETQTAIPDSSTQSDGYHQSYSALGSPLPFDDRHDAQHASPTSCATTPTREIPSQCSPLTPNFIWSPHQNEISSTLFAVIYQDLEMEVDSLGLDKTIPSLARSCVDHFFECLYPLMPIVYRPKIELGLCLLQPGIERREIDLEVFTLTMALCAIAAAIIPSTIFSQGSHVAEKFYRASKRGLELYRRTEQHKSSSIAIRYFQSGYTHSVGQPRTTFDELESAIELAQVMRLHDETSYARMDKVESQLCRRLFWVLFTGDKSAAILGKHQITLGRYLLESGITVRYSDSLEGEDPEIPRDLAEPLPRLITGFNLNQDLWRAAYLVLLEIEALRDKCRELGERGNGFSRMHISAELSQLSDLYIAFETCLGNAPTCLRATPTLSNTPATFFFDQEKDTPPPPRAFALQRINLQVSYQCLRLVIVQAMSTSITPYHSVSPFWTAFLPLNYMSPGSASSSDIPSPTLAHNFNISEQPTLARGSSALLLQKVRVAEEMLHVLHLSSLENLRLNGESCVEKIRLVGAAMLEIVDHHGDSMVAGMASRFKELYPHILAHLRSKASDSLAIEECYKK